MQPREDGAEMVGSMLDCYGRNLYKDMSTVTAVNPIVMNVNIMVKRLFI